MRVSRTGRSQRMEFGSASPTELGDSIKGVELIFQIPQTYSAALFYSENRAPRSRGRFR